MSESDTNVASRLGIDPVVDRDLEGAHDGLELAERQSLRRVAGLRTELEDITEVEYRQLRLERVVLVGVWTEGSAEDAENSIAELKLLAETAGSDVLDALLQRRQRPDPATFIGSGKVEELTAAVQATGADTIICDGELAPSQLRNLEDRTKVKVVDRTALILDIFAQHAKSAEGKAQVELAQLQYQTQRLRGWGGNLSRQAGGRAAGGEGIGGRGPGETKLETDRRRIQSRMAKLRRELTALRTSRSAAQLRRDPAAAAANPSSTTNALPAGPASFSPPKTPLGMRTSAPTLYAARHTGVAAASFVTRGRVEVPSPGKMPSADRLLDISS